MGAQVVDERRDRARPARPPAPARRPTRCAAPRRRPRARRAAPPARARRAGSPRRRAVSEKTLTRPDDDDQDGRARLALEVERRARRPLPPPASRGQRGAVGLAEPGHELVGLGVRHGDLPAWTTTGRRRIVALHGSIIPCIREPVRPSFLHIRAATTTATGAPGAAHDSSQEVDDMTDDRTTSWTWWCARSVPRPPRSWTAIALPSTDGPVEHVKVQCLSRHWFLLPAAALPPVRTVTPEPGRGRSDERRPHQPRPRDPARGGGRHRRAARSAPSPTCSSTAASAATSWRRAAWRTPASSPAPARARPASACRPG